MTQIMGIIKVSLVPDLQHFGNQLYQVKWWAPLFGCVLGPLSVSPFDRARNLQKCLSAKPALTEEHLKQAANSSDASSEPDSGVEISWT